MLRFRPPRVLILTNDDANARLWTEALADATADVWLAAEEVPHGLRPDVIVTDLAADEVARRTGPLGPAARADDSPPVGSAVVGIGALPWADVALPTDCTMRELRLACQLVAEIAHLRGQRDELDRIRREATRLAETDPLTGLPNRRAWEQQLDARLSLGPARLWLAILDLDGFKQVNDRQGMAAGDAVLARLAAALAGQLRREDMVARLGGDEFGIQLWDVGAEHVTAVLDRLRAAVADEAVAEQAVLGGGVRITASIGYVAAADGGSDVAALFAAAERAMREAKRAGGNRALRAACS